MSNLTDADLYAEDLARALGFAAPPGVSALADRVWGRGAIGLVSRGPAFQLVRRGGGHALFLRDDVEHEVRHWTAARELARFCLEQDGVRLSSAQVGGAIVLPRASFARSLSRVSAQIVAANFDAPVAATMLRDAELHDVPTAIVTPRWSRVRGDRRGRLPTDHATLRAIASGGVGVVGLRKTKTPQGETLIRVALRPEGDTKDRRETAAELLMRFPRIRVAIH